VVEWCVGDYTDRLDSAPTGRRLFCKGAPHEVLARCSATYNAHHDVTFTDLLSRPLTPQRRRKILQVVDSLGAAGLRSIALATRDLSHEEAETMSRSEAEMNLTLLAIVALLDHVRPEVSGVVQQCRRAGIDVKLLTGECCRPYIYIYIYIYDKCVCVCVHTHTHTHPHTHTHLSPIIYIIYIYMYSIGDNVETAVAVARATGILLEQDLPPLPPPPSTHTHTEPQQNIVLGEYGGHAAEGVGGEGVEGEEGADGGRGGGVGDGEVLTGAAFCGSWDQDMSALEVAALQVAARRTPRDKLIIVRNLRSRDRDTQTHRTPPTHTEARTCALTHSERARRARIPYERGREGAVDQRGETDRERGVRHDVEGMVGVGVEGLGGGGHVVAVAGHRWHLAPALREAHVGVSLGAPGAQMAQAAAGLVLKDNNLTSLVEALNWGRGVRDNMRRFIQFQLTVSLSGILLLT